jgi:1A family penicillin-binding protein
MTKKRKKSHFILIFLGLSAICAGFVFIWATTLPMPNVEAFNSRIVTQSTKIFDRSGEVLLYDLQTDTRRTSVPLSEISDNIQKATIAIEDSSFYEHHGIRPTSLIRAVFANSTALGYSQGGSTITQQVIKNSLLTKEKKISRKFKEIILALRLEKQMSKDKILEVYLNENPYGGSVYGVEEASQTFFGKHAKELGLAQSAFIAALPQAPTYYSPYGTHKKELEDRKNLVLSRMLALGYITKEQYDSASTEKVVFNPQSPSGIKAPHFVFYIKDYLENKYGKQVLDNGGLKVTTTLDWDLESKAEEIVKRTAFENKKKFNAENASLVAIDPKTGQILTMVGSRDYFDKEIDGAFNISTALRQPGSSFKPFVYATAFKKGYLPQTVLFDAPTEFSTMCSVDSKPLYNGAVCYNPENYDKKFRGPISLRGALAQSLNIPSVKLLYLAGIKDSLQTAKDMGISTLGDESRYGLTLVLGGGEVKLLDMVSAYSVFADDGVRNHYTGILKVEDANGNILESYENNQSQVLDSDIARTISDVLSDDNARIPSYGANSALYFKGLPVAAKTGTTNDYKDTWILGYSTSIASGAWAGNNDNTPIDKKVAGFVVAPMWHEFMQYALVKYPPEDFPKATPKDISNYPSIIKGIYQGGKTVLMDKTTGSIANESTSKENIMEVPVGGEIHSILYWIDKNNPLSSRTDDPNNDPQYKYWEYGIQKWLETNKTTTSN